MSVQPGNRLRFLPAALLSGLTVLTGGTLLAQTRENSGEPSLLPIVYFYSPTCLQCRKADESISAVERKYAGKVRVERHNIATAEGLELMFAYEEKYGASQDAPPKVFVGKQYLGDEPAIRTRLDAAVRDELVRRQPSPAIPVAAPAAVPSDSPAATEPQQALPDLAASPRGSQEEPPPDTSPTSSASSIPTSLSAASEEPRPGERLDRRFRSFRVGAVMLAGLVDGVNPCAFTTVVFLLSAMAYLGKTKRQIAVVGIAFTAAVFFTYLLLGLGVMLAIKTFAVQTGVSQIVTYVIAGLTFALAGWSLFDGIRIARSGKIPRGSLSLPLRIKVVIRRVIKAGLKTRNLILGSLVVGFLVSLLESLCTGQIYMPTILIMLRSPEYRRSAFLLLLTYNLMFILPLAVIMAAAYFGVRSEWLGQILRRHVAALKFALAGLFIGLGVLLLIF